MGYTYLATFGEGLASESTRLSLRTHATERLRLRLAASTGCFDLFAASSTPVLSLPDGQILIGHLFDASGRAATDFSAFSELADFKQARKHILDKYWGEYLLFQPAAAGSSGLTVMRDPSGGVPCLYSDARCGTGFVTSDITLARALGIHRESIDWNFISRCLMYPNARTGATGLCNVEELLPGRALELQGANALTSEEWSPWMFLAGGNRHTNLEDAATDIRSTVERSVRTWAETDGTVLMELSGGLDSSIVAMCLRDTTSRVKLCTVSTPMAGGDETVYARQVADALGASLECHVLGFDGARHDAPLPPSAVVPCIGPLQCAVDEVMVAAGTGYGAVSHFCGAGGDTVFGARSNASPAVDALKEKGLRAGLSAVHDIATLHQCTVWKAGRLTTRKMIRPASLQPAPEITFLRHSHTLPLEPHPWSRFPSGSLCGDRERAIDLAGIQMFRDDAPRGGNRWVRMPLLSQPVVEACLRVPTWLQVSGGINRAVARRAFRDVLPVDVHNRRSKGTFVAYSGSVYQRRKTEMQQFLAHGHLQEKGLLDIPALEAYLASPTPPRDRSFMRIFDLCMIENWVRRHA